MICIYLESKRTDITYQVNIFTKLNKVNMDLQGHKECLIRTKEIIIAFIKKRVIYKNDKNFYQFLCVQAL